MYAVKHTLSAVTLSVTAIIAAACELLLSLNKTFSQFLHFRGVMEWPGMEGARSRQQYKCEGCHLTPRGCDLSHHYKSVTNFGLLRELSSQGMY